VKSLFRGKVTVIGELDYSDYHSTVVGNTPGYVLQANYVESLLDDRLILPVPEWVDLLTGLGIFLLYERFFDSFRGYRSVLAVLGLFIFTTLIVYLAVNLLGYYLNPAFFSILSVLSSRIIEVVAPRHLNSVQPTP
jgi:hypothetical protein